MRIGVLALQGGVSEHLEAINKLGHQSVEIKKVTDLNNIDAIILPGGESTTIGKLLKITGMLEPLREKIRNGFPTWGTCAGMILLAKDIENDDRRYLSLLDVTVRRNAFGSQIDSFKIKKIIKEVSDKEIELVFIRAPYVTKAKDNVNVLLSLEDKIVAVRQDNIFATSFHPELTNDLSFLKYFIAESEKYVN